MRFKELVKEVLSQEFGDTSSSGISAAVYTVITQASRVSKGLIATKIGKEEPHNSEDRACVSTHGC